MYQKNSWKEYLEKIKGKKEQWLILLLVGILLLVIAIPVSEKKDRNPMAEDDTDKGMETDETYSSHMEEKLAKVLNHVKGVGKVSVMITISESSEKIIEKDEETSIQTSSREGDTSSSTDRNESSVYSGGGSDEVPYVKKEISPQIEGVLVVAEGGDDPVVVESITSAVQALFGIEPHKIKVMKHN